MIQTHNLSIGYKNKVLARNVNVVLQPGALVCLLGQNGVGKSTLIRTIANLQASISGELTIEGQPIHSFAKGDLARKIGIVTTQRVGASNMKVREMVALGRYPYTNWIGKESATDKQAIQDSISICEIDYIQSHKLGEISDGQYQKVMIARALAQDTEYLILDEPTAHLDIVNRRLVFKLLAEVAQKRDKGVLVSTHELDLALEFSDQLWLMDFNAPMINGTPEELQNDGSIDKVFHLDQR